MSTRVWTPRGEANRFVPLTPLTNGLALAGVATALGLWLLALRDVELEAMTDLGLAAVLPWTAYAALFVLIAGYCLTLRANPLPTWLVLIETVTLVFMLYGVTAMVETAPRTPIAWRLVGIVDYIQTNGAVNPNIDAFFNWPGFFIFTAFVSQTLGYAGPIELAHWASVLFNLLYLAPLLVLVQSATPDRRVRWLAVWFFYLGNWIGQDYLAPQAFGYFFFLCVLAILLRWFKSNALDSPPLRERLPLGGDPPRRDSVRSSILIRIAQGDSPNADMSSATRVGLMALVVLIYAATVPSHQLTPIAILGAVTALVLFRRITPRYLPLLMGVMLALWISFMTVPFLSGHLHDVTAPLGAVADNVGASLVGRYRGSSEHILIVNLRVGMSLSMWALAIAGAVRRWHAGFADVNFALLAIAPLILLPLLRYGGEMLLRVYLLSLPFVAFFAASLFLPSERAQISRRSAAVLGVVSLVLTGLFLFSRYGNERMDYFSENEVAAVRHVYENAPPGSLLLAGTGHIPWRYQDYTNQHYLTVESRVRDGDAEGVARVMSNEKYPATYLILTRSQQASAELFIGWVPGTWDKFVQALEASNRFQAVYENDDARVLQLKTRSK